MTDTLKIKAETFNKRRVDTIKGMNLTDDNSSRKGSRSDYYRETYRPQFHYSPEKNWMNDPNGMVYFEGEYHLFYQHTPHDTQPDFGRMHWGHAVSKDLVHWDELPPAIPPGEDGAIFSGSAVVDKNNTSGFFNEEGSGLVAIYTNEGNKAQPGKSQVQSIAYSKDKGRTWTKYEGNPVLFPAETLDFRDPKVFWYDESSMWIMVLAVRDRVEFYTSPNLKEWSFASEFGSDISGIHRGVFECPDVFRISVDEDSSISKWILMLSVGDRNGVNPNDPEPPAGGSGMMYFIGNFDGKVFTLDETLDSFDTTKWVDYGSDFYAAVTWSGIPNENGRKIWVGWMNNWRYATTLPSEEWRGKTSISRELQLRTYPEGLRLIQAPISELSQLRKPILSLQDLTIKPGMNVLSDIFVAKAEIIAEFEINNVAELRFKVRKSSNQETIVGYNVSNEELFVDRTKSGTIDFHSDFTAKHKAPMKPEDGRIQLSIYVDWSSVEVFGNNGKAVISDLIFPDLESRDLELYAIGGELKVLSLQINDLVSIWGNETV
ncbi:glycoside hydrolase family 32 protein [Paenibacillus terrae]|nr:glycoside hydrolase family 32 protein [Paenibacillus terrae]